jgi:hypothetical protein
LVIVSSSVCRWPDCNQTGRRKALLRSTAWNGRISQWPEATLANLPDARVEGRTDHDLLDIVVLALCAVMAGAEGRDSIEDLGA